MISCPGSADCADGQVRQDLAGHKADATSQCQRMQRRCRPQKVAVIAFTGMFDRRQFRAVDKVARLEVVAGKKAEARTIQVDRPIAVA